MIIYLICVHVICMYCILHCIIVLPAKRVSVRDRNPIHTMHALHTQRDTPYTRYTHHAHAHATRTHTPHHTTPHAHTPHTTLAEAALPSYLTAPGLAETTGSPSRSSASLRKNLEYGEKSPEYGDDDEGEEMDEEEEEEMDSSFLGDEPFAEDLQGLNYYQNLQVRV